MIHRLILSGKSNHGRETIRTSGERWRVVKTEVNVDCKNSKTEPGPYALIECEPFIAEVGSWSLSPSINIRWISLTEDRDFRVERTWEE